MNDSETKNVEIIKDIFTKTNKILGPVWAQEENPQISHILYYLSLVAGYLKGKEEAVVFHELWEVEGFKDLLKSGADFQDWLNHSNMINKHSEQALLEESVHSPSASNNPGILWFYENKFDQLYQDAKKEYDTFQKKKDEMVKGMQAHHESVFSSQDSWEDALRRGDPMALVD